LKTLIWCIDVKMLWLFNYIFVFRENKRGGNPGAFLIGFCWDLILFFFNVYFDIQDLSARIMSISQSGARNICILSANGSISSVTLRQPASSGGTVTYEVHLQTKIMFCYSKCFCLSVADHFLPNFSVLLFYELSF